MPRSLPAGDSTVIMHGAMSELQNAQHLLEEAKRAADAGDLAAADALLRNVARIQESELGAVNPELANTVNNLAVVAEMDRRLHDAEAFYRRALAIASASLAADDPVLVSSRKNLEDFCRDHGLPFDAPAPAVTVTEATDHPLEPVAADHTIVETERPWATEVVNATAAAPTPAPVLQTPAIADSTVREVEAPPIPAAPSRRPLVIAVMVLVALVAAMLLVTRPWSAHQPQTSDRVVEPAAPAPADPSPPSVTTPAPKPTEQPPAVGSRDTDARDAAPSPARSAGGMTLVTSQLCRTLSTGQNWRCDPADQSVAPGPLVLYTRVKSARDGVVIHQWYRGNTLRKSARLPVQANTTDGYRTYSRQTVNRGEDWRVEVRTTAGDLLYEQRVSVR